MTLLFCSPGSAPPRDGRASARSVSPTRPVATTRLSPVASKKTTGWTDEELLAEAKEIILRDLLEAFQSDLKTRIVSVKILEDMAAVEKESVKNSSTSSTPAPVRRIVQSSSTFLAAQSSSTKPTKVIPPLLQLTTNVKSTRLSSEAPSESHSTPIDDDSERHSSREPSISRRPSIRTNLRPLEVSGGETPESPGPRKTKTRRVRPERHFTSSEEDNGGSADETKEKSSPAMVMVVPEMIEERRESKRKVLPQKKSHKKVKIKKEPVIVVEVEDDRESSHIEEGSIATPTVVDEAMESDRDEVKELTPRPPPRAKVTAKKAKGRQFVRERSTTPDPIEAGIAADEEDLYYMKMAIERPRRGLALHPDPLVEVGDELYTGRHFSGAARTEGYYVITGAEKMANRPSATSKTVIEAPAAASGVAVSRLARVNTRGLVRGMELHKKVTATDTDVLKFNQLRTRKKQLSFSRSGIHDYGLFAMEYVPACIHVLAWRLTHESPVVFKQAHSGG